VPTTSPSEHDIQNEIMDMLKTHPRVAWAQRINTGAVSQSYLSTSGVRKARYIRYGFVGCSDILGQMRDGRVLAIEVKKPGGKATKEQVDFLKLVLANGGVAGIAHGVNQALAIVAEDTPLTMLYSCNTSA
jgi:hypothetical protein